MDVDNEADIIVFLQTLRSLKCLQMQTYQNVDFGQVLTFDEEGSKETGDNILHIACDRGWRDLVQELVANHGDEIDVNCLSFVEPASPLMIAASKGDINIMELLLQHPQINVDLIEEDGSGYCWTAVFWAANYFLEEYDAETAMWMMKTLIHHGASIDLKYKDMVHGTITTLLSLVASNQWNCLHSSMMFQYLVEEAGCPVTPDVMHLVRKHNPGSAAEALCQKWVGVPRSLKMQARAAVRKTLMKAATAAACCARARLTYTQRIGKLIEDGNLPKPLLSYLLCDTMISEARLKEIFPNLFPIVEKDCKDENFNDTEATTASFDGGYECEDNSFIDVTLALDFVVSLEDEYPKQRRRGGGGAVGVARKLWCDAVLQQIMTTARKCLNRGVNVNTVMRVLGCGKWSGLNIAAKGNYLELLDLLLSQPSVDVDLGTTIEIGLIDWTPLMIACRAGHHEVVRRLLQVPGISILQEDSFGDTALHWAAREGHSECLKELAMVPGLDWNHKDVDGRTPLCTAIYGHPDSVRIIVAQPGVDFSVKTINGTTLAEAAVTSTWGDPVECVKILADVEDLDWNVKMNSGDTPLRYCLKKNKTEMFNVLAECPRVDLNVRDEAGDSLILWCLKNRRFNEFRVLRRNPRVDLRSAITWAVKNKKLVIVKQLRQALEYRLADLERKLKMSWRGRGDPGAGSLMLEEITVMKLRSQLNLCRRFSDLKRKHSSFGR